MTSVSLAKVVAMKRLLVALLLCLPSMAMAQRDSTVCVSFRIRTATTGAIQTTSVTKITCVGAAGRVDTVTITRVDTLKPTPAPVPLDPRGYNCWQARDAANPTCITDDKITALSQTLVLHRYGQTFGFHQWMWKGVIYPVDPSLPTTGTVRVDTVTVPVPGPVVHDTVPVIVIRVDTLYRPSPTPTPTPTPAPGAPELPRGMAAMDSMIAESRRADNLPTAPHYHQDADGKWVCYLNCTPAAITRAKAMNVAPKTVPKKAAPTKPIKEPVG